MQQCGCDEISIFAGTDGKKFVQKMCDYLGIKPGNSETIIFSDDNTFVRVNESIRKKDVFILQSVAEKPNDNFMELLFWIDAFKRASANSVTVLMPYFSYAKGDKKDEPRVSIRARVCADALEITGADRVVFMELHSPQVQGFFKIPVDHLNPNMLFYSFFKRNGYLDDDDLVIVSPDTGYAKRARVFADIFAAPVAIGDKIRVDHTENAKIMNIIGDVKDKNCLIIDDFSVTAGTIVDVAYGLKERGAKNIFCALSHCLLKEEGVKKIMDSPIEFVVTTDTVNCPAIEDNDCFRIISAAPLFAETVRRIQCKESLGDMFEHLSDRLLEQSMARQSKLF